MADRPPRPLTAAELDEDAKKRGRSSIRARAAELRERRIPVRGLPASEQPFGGGQGFDTQRGQNMIPRQPSRLERFTELLDEAKRRGTSPTNQEIAQGGLRPLDRNNVIQELGPNAPSILPASERALKSVPGLSQSPVTTPPQGAPPIGRLEDQPLMKGMPRIGVPQGTKQPGITLADFMQEFNSGSTQADRVKMRQRDLDRAHADRLQAEATDPARFDDPFGGKPPAKTFESELVVSKADGSFDGLKAGQPTPIPGLAAQIAASGRGQGDPALASQQTPAAAAAAGAAAGPLASNGSDPMLDPTNRAMLQRMDKLGFSDEEKRAALAGTLDEATITGRVQTGQAAQQGRINAESTASLDATEGGPEGLQFGLPGREVGRRGNAEGKVVDVMSGRRHISEVLNDPAARRGLAAQLNVDVTDPIAFADAVNRFSREQRQQRDSQAEAGARTSVPPGFTAAGQPIAPPRTRTAEEASSYDERVFGEGGIRDQNRARHFDRLNAREARQEGGAQERAQFRRRANLETGGNMGALKDKIRHEEERDKAIGVQQTKAQAELIAASSVGGPERHAALLKAAGELAAAGDIEGSRALIALAEGGNRDGGVAASFGPLPGISAGRGVPGQTITLSTGEVMVPNATDNPSLREAREAIGDGAIDVLDDVYSGHGAIDSGTKGGHAHRVSANNRMIRVFTAIGKVKNKEQAKKMAKQIAEEIRIKGAFGNTFKMGATRDYINWMTRLLNAAAETGNYEAALIQIRRKMNEDKARQEQPFGGFGPRYSN